MPPTAIEGIALPNGEHGCLHTRSNDLLSDALIVGIGASAGGLAAFTTFLANTPADTGMAFVLVQHLDPHHKSLLVELLGARASIPVLEAQDGVAVRANCVFIIPPDATLTIKDGILRVVTPAPPREQRRPIDTFFAALAEDRGDRAVAIVLSGVGSDGAHGVSVIKEHGGLTVLQKTLRPAVSAAVEQAFATERTVINENLMAEIDGKTRSLTLIVEPVSSNGAKNQDLCVVAFRDASQLGRDAGAEASPATTDAGSLTLEKELRATKSQLLAATDQLEAYIEDMKSTTEEYQAVTEELQSSNEELETAKEELQSVNEELQTINGELQSKNDAMERLNSDLKNLLDSTQIATVFLDDALRIKHYTPAMEQLFSLRDVDRGRPITDVVSQLAYDELRNDVQKVQSTLGIVERELELKGGAACFLMRIRPYRTIQDIIDGVVITFADITANKHAQRTREVLIDELQHRTRNLLAVVQSISDTTLAAAGSLDDYAAEFNNRLQALSRVQGLLSRREDAPVTLTEIVRAELAAVGVTPGGERIIVDGPPVTLSHQSMQLLALALHELSTNALKHGALNGARGRLNVTWQILDRTENPRLELTWVESGVELDKQAGSPLRHGFGRELLEKAVPYQLDAKTRLELGKDGVRCWLDMPLREYEQREL